jgi:hypothetical protein
MSESEQKTIAALRELVAKIPHEFGLGGEIKQGLGWEEQGYRHMQNCLRCRFEALLGADTDAQRPNVSGASPVCLDCSKAGLQNCSHFDNCDGTWIYKTNESRASVLEEAAQLVEGVGGVVNDHSDAEDNIWSRRMHNIAERIRNLSAQREEQGLSPKSEEEK